MLNIESLAVDQELASNGTWADFAGARFLIARYNNDKASLLRNKLALENMKVLQSGTKEADEKSDEITLKVLTETVLLDWQDVGSKDVAIKYTPKQGHKYLADPRFSDLREFIQNYSINRANYQEEVEVEVSESVKNTAAS